MHIRRTVSNSNLKNDETDYNLLDRIKPGSHEDYYSLPNLYRFNYEFNEATWNSLIIKAVINLDYTFLRMPIIIKSYLIRDVMNIILDCQFSQEVIREGFEYIRKFSSITFKAILDKVTKRNYPLIAKLISKSLDIMCDVDGFTIIWPLHLILILAEKDFKLSIKSNLILSAYDKYISNNLENKILEGCPILHKEDYDALKKITVHLY